MDKTTWTKKGLMVVTLLTAVNLIFGIYLYRGFIELQTQNVAAEEAQKKRDGEIRQQLSDMMALMQPAKEPIVAVAAATTQNEEVKPSEKSGHSSRRFTKTFKEGRPWEEVKKDDFGSRRRDVPIKEHRGGQVLDFVATRASIKAVVNRLPNLKYTKELEDLLFETLAAESGVGELKLSTAAKSRNYGIAQLRLDDTKELLGWLEKIRPDVHREIMLLKNDRHDLCWNITYNVPFSIAMMTQFYWRRVPDIYAHINSVTQRAELWKAKYNTYLGAGTVNYYLKRTKEYTS